MKNIPASRTWVNRTVVGIILATFFSDFSHEMCTAILPLFLASVNLGPAALGIMEGLADLLMSLSRLAGGVVGHHVRYKRPWAAVGYLVTTLATGAMALFGGLAALVSLRGAAWVGRGFRSPLRDYLLADAVEKTHYGRAYGLERAGDMLGAVIGPLLAALFIWFGVSFRNIILWTLVPGMIAVSAMLFLTKERREVSGHESPSIANTKKFPTSFWMFLIGVFFFGLGDFSRTFLIWLAAQALGESGTPVAGVLSTAVLLYTLHNLASAFAAYPVGHLGDRRSKLPVLTSGYALGVFTNLVLLCVILNRYGNKDLRTSKTAYVNKRPCGQIFRSGRLLGFRPGVNLHTGVHKNL